MNTILTFSGLLFVFLGLAYMYRPSWILTINKFARERIFCDARVILERRQKGLLFLLCSVLLFYWSYSRALYSPTRIMDYFVSTDRMFYQARNNFRVGEYGKADRACLKILSREPENSEALYLLAASRYLSGDKSGAEEVWSKAELVRAMTPMAQQFRDVCLRFKRPTTL